MLSATIQSLWAHRRRLAGALIAIVLGVAFLSGTLALGDTLQANFTKLFARADAGTDAVVRSTQTIGTKAGLIPAATLARVTSVAGVASAQAVITGYGQLIGANGKAIGGNGPPRVAANWITDAVLNPYHLVRGRAPQSDDEVVINRGAATSGDLAVGSVTVIQMPQPVTVTVVGIATFGSDNGFGTETYAAFSLQGAQEHILGSTTQLSSVWVRAGTGVSQGELVGRLAKALPADLTAVTGAQFNADSLSALDSEFLNVLRGFLDAFALIALLVASFSIHNAVSILLAQRQRESALLRAIGATRAQTLRALLGESLAIGVAGSAVGVLSGIGVAAGLKGVFDAFSFALPAGGLVLRPESLTLAFLAGVVVTSIAGVAPAVRSSRIAPIAALRAVAAEDPATSRGRVLAGGILTAAGIAAVALAVTSGVSGGLALAGLGALVTIAGVLTLGPAVAGPVTAALGKPIEALRGVTGALARRNAIRNPRRTSATAAALLVGVSVVTLFTVLAASLKAGLTTGLRASVGADLVIASGSYGGGGFSPQLASDVARLPQVGAAAGMGSGEALVDGSQQSVSILAADGATAGGGRAALVNLSLIAGSLPGPANPGLAVSQAAAKAKGLAVGSRVGIVLADGTRQQLRVTALYRSTDLAGNYVIPPGVWAPHDPQLVDSDVYIALRPGVSLAAGEAAVDRVTAGYGDPTLETRAAYVGAAGSGVNIILGIVYVLLALAILIALAGISNAMSMSAQERITELGLLRAVGQTRAQLRSMVRWESVTIAVFGTAGGLATGAFLGWALARAAGNADGVTSFALPAVPLAVILLSGALAGVLAGIRPARRAAQVDLLVALSAQ